MEIYRFRSMENLLGEYQELENKTIYFASPDQLNDPMEGYRDIVWRGDKIVWTNFFKHYVFCLHGGYFQFRMCGDSKELGVGDIPFLGRWDQISTSQAQGLFDDIWHRFLKLPNIPEIIEALSNRSSEIRYIELRYYLRVIHSVILEQIVGSYIAHGILSQSEMPQLPRELSVQVLLQCILESIRLFGQAETEGELNAALRKIEAMDNDQRIIHQLNSPISSEVLRKNNQLIVSDFPTVYLKEIENLHWPKWYTACFMKNYHNSSVWSHYGDQHRGVCLIFESEKTDSSHRLNLHQMTDNSVKQISFYEIRYRAKRGTVDFFQYIGSLSKDALMKLWYTDREGNISKYAAHIQSDDDRNAWQRKYWDSFLRDITIKTKDWKYEQEYRLILCHGLSGFVEEKNRTLKYNFNSLKGIIFGIKTPDEHRSRIIEIIQEKREKYERRDFKFYQAYYSQETGDIRKHEIRLS